MTQLALGIIGWNPGVPAGAFNECIPPFAKGGPGGISMVRAYRSRLKPLSRSLRSNMTDAEQLLWGKLRRKQIHGVQFYRQKPIGPFIVDFFAPAAGLVVELDGGQHFESETVEKDRERDAFLTSQGLTVLRFDNRQAMLETEAVLGVIAEVVLRARGNPPQPPFCKGGSKAGSGEGEA